MGAPNSSNSSEQPDHRQVATFFLGWVFITAINNMATSAILQNVVARVFSRFRRSSCDHPKIDHCDDGSGSPFKLMTDCPILLFTLSSFFMSASITSFVSLLSFDSGPEMQPLCQFVVAWSGLSVQFARLVALFLLLFALRRSGIKLLETVIYLAWLLIGLGLEFAIFTISIGTVKLVQSEELCYRERDKVLPLSLAASSVFLMLEIYVIGRTLVLTHSHTQGQREWLGDIHVVQACSLLVFDLMTVLPSAVFIGVLGEFIPLSIGSVLVLVCFNRRNRPAETSPSFDSVTPSSEFSQDLPFEKENNPHGLTVIPMPPRISRFTMGAIARPLSPIPPLPMHPYSAQCLDDTKMEVDGDRWLGGYDTARSSRTVDTRTARSIDEAVFEVAQRSRPVPIYYEGRRSVPSGPQTPSISSSGRFRELSMDDLILPFARPRLITVPSNVSVDLDVKPDTPVSGVRDSIAYDPLLKSRFSVSTGSVSLTTTSSLISSSDRVRRQLTAKSAWSDSSEEVPALPERPMQFRAAGYSNPIQSRWPTLYNESRVCRNDSPQALREPEKDTDSEA
ncbi:uncharacterized protein EV420DRAFT_1504326 [Desarmillaria tabescens]|uniref:Uncharacterized protein n=1 Tax=Armillaria tabescens TaxID=1929756 RepID=A0AA39NMV0_ARMTA|nr:uncharacterized protein EV420DRAFT_1504326 [Desarmillaria tabescens]KAK0468409.1 hypothetical protein EV420DRAFT_1504326 [Desarmillaria tabescens]